MLERKRHIGDMKDKQALGVVAGLVCVTNLRTLEAPMQDLDECVYQLPIESNCQPSERSKCSTPIGTVM